MITYHNADGSQTHQIGFRHSHRTYTSIFTGGDLITIDSDLINIEIKYGPDVNHPQLTLKQSIPREVVFLFEYK